MAGFEVHEIEAQVTPNDFTDGVVAGAAVVAAAAAVVT